MSTAAIGINAQSLLSAEDLIRFSFNRRPTSFIACLVEEGPSHLAAGRLRPRRLQVTCLYSSVINDESWELPVGVIHVFRLCWVKGGENLRRAESCRRPTSGRYAMQRWNG